MRKIIYIVNPISGTRSKKDLNDFIAKETMARKIEFQIFPSVANGDYSFLDTIIREEKITDIVIAGGDGTVSQVVGSLMHHAVTFGIIPCGSGNGLAYAAKIPKQADKALGIIFKGRSILIDGFYINKQFACMLSGLGFDARVAHDFAQQPKRGLTTYIKQVVKNFFAAKPYRFAFSVNNIDFTTDAFLVCVANSNQFGNNFTIAPKANLSDGLLDIVIVTNQNKLNLLLQTVKQIRGKNKLQTDQIKTKKSVIYFQCEKIRIKNLSQAPLHIDGDPAETPSEVVVEVKKKCFRLLQ